MAVKIDGCFNKFCADWFLVYIRNLSLFDINFYTNDQWSKENGISPGSDPDPPFQVFLSGTRPYALDTGEQKGSQSTSLLSTRA